MAIKLNKATLNALGLTEAEEASRTSLFGRFAKSSDLEQAVL
jgi:hypothetical protein